MQTAYNSFKIYCKITSTLIKTHYSYCQQQAELHFSILSQSDRVLDSISLHCFKIKLYLATTDHKSNQTTQVEEKQSRNLWNAAGGKYRPYYHTLLGLLQAILSIQRFIIKILAWIMDTFCSMLEMIWDFIFTSPDCKILQLQLTCLVEENLLFSDSTS